MPRLQTVRAAARYTYTKEGRKEEGGNDRANDGDNDEDDDDDDDEAAHPERPSDWNVDWTEGDAERGGRVAVLLRRGPKAAIHHTTPPHRVRMNGQLDQTDGIRAGYPDTETIEIEEGGQNGLF